MKKLITILIIFSLLLITFLLSAESICKDDFADMKNWYDNKTDKSFNAVIVPSKNKGAYEVIQKGNGNWGKVAFVLVDVDLDKFEIVKIKVNDVSKNGDYKIAVTPVDWKDQYILIDRGAGKGMHTASIKDATGWKGKKTFNLVVIIEGKGKKVELDSIELISKEEE